MTFKEIEHLVRDLSAMPEASPLHEQMCYCALRCLYEDFRRGAIDKDDATAKKRRLWHAFERAESKAQIQEQLCKEWTNGLKVSDEFRIKLHKALNSGKGLDVLFPLACTCIAAMTGDQTLLGSEVKEKLKAMQMSMDNN